MNGRGVRVAVVGAGGAAQVVHLPILRRLPEVEVAAVVDPDVARARTIAERFGVSVVAASLAKVPDGDRLDAAVVCTPNQTHEEVVHEALAAGLHVLCERPLSVSADSAARMVAAAREAERHLMVAMNQRFRYDVRAIRHFVTSGDLGQVFFLRSSWLNTRHRRPRRGWRTGEGGGVLMELGAQAIDVALWLLGYPRVERVTARLHRREAVDDSAVALLVLAGGATISVEATWELMEERDRHALYVFGTTGSARTNPFRVQKEVELGLVDVTPPLDRSGSDLYTDSYRQEWAEFLRAVRGEKRASPPEEQVHLMRVVEACYRSAEEGREVPV